MRLKIQCDFCGIEFERDVCQSQSEHAKLHMREKKFWEGGDFK